MPPASPAPRSQNQWLTHLQSQQPPLDPAVREALLAELAGGTASSAQFAALLQQDPPQVLMVLREANRALTKYGRDAATLEHAITLLGTERVRKLLLAAPALDPGHPNAADYRQALLRSQHAAWQARLWAEGSGRWHPEDLYWATLLAGAPLWLLWLEAGPLLRQLQRLRAEGLSTDGAVQKRILGSVVAPLCAALASAWQLPDISQESWRRDSIGTPRQWLQLARAARLEAPPVVPHGGVINDLSHHPALVAAVANLLAEEADWNWDSPRTLRLFRIAAACCRRPLSTLISSGHQTAAALSRAYADRHPASLLTPAERLLCHWREESLILPGGRPRRQPAPARADSRTLLSALRQLQRPEQLRTPREALELAPAALQVGLGLRRVAILHYRPAARTLQTLISAGCEMAPALQQLHCPVEGPLLTQLLQKPTCITLGPENQARYLPHLPPPLRAATEVERLLLASLFAGQTPLALLYADNGGEAISDEQVRLLKGFCQQLSTALGQLLRRHAGGG